jgi:hypothetical protein|tara:strand:- start:710 stop:901 length:192 start_codon:yes stop_codon:yes gene_type:complete
MMKTYIEQAYKVSIVVKVSYPATLCGSSWIDGIKGLNIGHALYLARQNWEGATIDYIGLDTEV